jgi:hypothetical protein
MEYYVFDRPPNDDGRRLELLMWQVEFALSIHLDAADHHDIYGDTLYREASALVRVVTGMDDEAAHRALNRLEELQAGEIGEYEAELDFLARLSLVTA